MCSVVVDCWTNSEAGKKKRARLTILSLLFIVSPAAEGAPASSAVEAVTLGEGEGGGEERGGGEG